MLRRCFTCPIYLRDTTHSIWPLGGTSVSSSTTRNASLRIQASISPAYLRRRDGAPAFAFCCRSTHCIPRLIYRSYSLHPQCISRRQPGCYISLKLPTYPVRPLFDDADADIIFRSSDDVDFRVYKVILAKASSVFRTMLDLPQPPSSNPNSTDESHVVKLTEDAKTLQHVFRLCYPTEHPNITPFADIHAVLEAARKYEIKCITTNLRWSLARITPKGPLRMYAVAYMLQLEDVARDAAKELLLVPQFHMPPSPPSEFSTLPCLAIYSMHVYRQRCLEVALHDLEDWKWIAYGPHDRASTGDASQVAEWIWFECISGHGPPRVLAGNVSHHTQGWFETYVMSLKTALSVRRSGGTVLSHLTSSKASEIFTRVGNECTSCRSRAHADLVHFSNLLAVRIDTAIAPLNDSD
ncbi:hypothetical protein BD311DRAFT_391309 [Dichomitus squalens]|uniref:BTB domain-containing protein n=1 Tax=Dichomitus squalens TaxID=114155 RepID=A0A4Q9N004_9APHY|nr:hypothetical protein BD311DRAFT_391309 [Dichomitus squalens]